MHLFQKIKRLLRLRGPSDVSSVEDLHRTARDIHKRILSMADSWDTREFYTVEKNAYDGLMRDMAKYEEILLKFVNDHPDQ
jgi:hypothetical protein